MKKAIRYISLAIIGLIVISALFVTIRRTLTKAQIAREAQIVPTSIPALEATNRLEILPLYEEARADESLEFGHGVSYLIRTDTATILMDLGNNPSEAAQVPALQNLQKLNISWEEIDAIVISHPHPDHVGGMKAWQNKTVSFGDFSGDLSKISIYAPITMSYPGTTVVYSSEPTLVSTDIATTGVIPFPEVAPLSLLNPKSYEQAVVIHVAGEGLVLITGCGHPTLEMLVTRAEALFGAKVIGVVGGLHYGEASAEDVQPHIEFLEARQPKLIALSPHDSESETLAAFRSAFPESYREIKVGATIQFP
ncbi:MAG TPA: MBL fold metallo-hydrolase [Anaerolineales bacterium]|nr:MBL fold metallo-hydrolase [Anaerolineales bacterium]